MVFQGDACPILDGGCDELLGPWTDNIPKVNNAR